MNLLGSDLVSPTGQKYRVGRIVGRGGFSVVYRGTGHQLSEYDYAIKVVEKRKVAGKSLENLQREVKIMRSVKHPNVMSLDDIVENEHYLFLISRYMEGGELFDKVVTAGAFTEADAIRILRQILEGLVYLHGMGICHRDLKPENLLCSAEEEFSVVITDFGFSKLFGHGELMQTSCGTLHYAAPEVLKGKPYDEGCDMWGVGCIAYVLLTGCFPFDGKAFEDISRKIYQGQYNVSQLEVCQVSDAARDFIQHLIIPESSRRMSSKDALQHPWLRSEQKMMRDFSLRQSVINLSAMRGPGGR